MIQVASSDERFIYAMTHPYRIIMISNHTAYRAKVTRRWLETGDVEIYL